MKAAIVIIAAFLVSCSGSSKDQKNLQGYDTLKDSLSVEHAENVEVVYTDSGILKAKISAPVMKRFPDADEPFLEMPAGVEARFYNENGEEQSTLTAQYAKSYERKDIIEIRDSVRILNINDEEIKGEEIIWDKKLRKVYSDKPVRVRVRDEKIIYAKKFESDETFVSYTLTNITGVVYLDEEGVETSEPDPENSLQKEINAN